MHLSWFPVSMSVCTLNINQKGVKVQDPRTYFSEFNGAFKLLASDYEEDSQVDTRVESGLQLEAFPVPAGVR